MRLLLPPNTYVRTAHDYVRAQRRKGELVRVMNQQGMPSLKIQGRGDPMVVNEYHWSLSASATPTGE
jgi:hypothetical protein